MNRAQLVQILDTLAEDSRRMFMRVNSKCAHHVRPPPHRVHRVAAGDHLFAATRE
jgi:hypothetical protein